MVLSGENFVFTFKKIGLTILFFLFAAFFSHAQTEAKLFRLGIDRLKEKNFEELRGKKVGLVANPASVNSQGRSTIEVLRDAKGVQLAALFAPEHGIDGVIKAGLHVANGKDKGTNLPVYSLYGDTRKPTPKMLKGLDVIVYDLQDIGCRSYTYISTLGLVMEAAMEQKLPVIVLDRPNPLGGERIEGPRLNPKFRSFVGMYDIPYVYGMTIGELAKWINVRHLPRPCDLKIILMTGWTRDMTWEDTHLRWTPTSPNIPTIESARGYVATGLLGEIGVTNGADEQLPFQLIVSEGLDAQWFSSKMNSYHFKGVEFVPYSFRPKNNKYHAERFSGARLKIDPKAKANLTAIAFFAYPLLKKIFPKRRYFGRADAVAMFDKLNGSNSMRHALQKGRSPSEIVASWNQGVSRWREERRQFLLYPQTDKKLIVSEAAGARMKN